MTFDAVHCPSYTQHTRSCKRWVCSLEYVDPEPLFIWPKFWFHYPIKVCLTFTELRCVYIPYKS